MTSPTTNPAKRGQFVAIERSHSYFTLGKGTTRYSEFHIARVVSITREGLVKTADFGSGVAYKARDWKMAWTIPAQHQAGAAALFGQSFDSQDAAVNAIRAVGTAIAA